MAIYDGSEDRDALAEIGVSDSEYYQGRYDDDADSEYATTECFECGGHFGMHAATCTYADREQAP